MAGEIIDTGTALKAIGWVVSAAAYGGGLIMYVRMRLNSHSDQLAKNEGRIASLERQVALGVRPKDIEALRTDIRELRTLIMNSKQ